MGIVNKATNNAIYLSIQSGQIAHRVKEATTTSRSRQLDNGKLIHEELFDNCEGIIRDIAFKESDFGKQLLITVENDGDRAILQMPLSSSPSTSFLKALPNIDLSAMVRFSPKLEEKDGKRKTTLFVSQNGKSIKWYWTKDNPGQLPPMKKIKIKGKEQWDDSEQIEFFEQFIATEIKPKLTGHSSPSAPSDDVVPENDEDAPF